MMSAMHGDVTQWRRVSQNGEEMTSLRMRTPTAHLNTIVLIDSLGDRNIADRDSMMAMKDML